MMEYADVITGGSLAVVTAIGIQRSGLLRAFGLAIRSRFFRKVRSLSSRRGELQILQNYEWPRQGYVVVIGAQGVGKSCLVETFTHKKWGVVECQIPQGTLQDDVINEALCAVAKLDAKSVDLSARARRTLFFYKLITFGKSPFLVIHASERLKTQLQPFAQMTGAVRQLTEDYGLHVIVDSCPDFVDPGLLATGRQFVLNVEPYDREQLWNIPEFRELFADLESVGLKLTFWSVFGGYPLPYAQHLRPYSTIAERGRDGKLTEAGKKVLQGIVWKAVVLEINMAIKILGSAIVKHKQMETILKLMDKETLHVPSSVLFSKKIQRPDPDYVLREVYRDGKRFVVPATPAIGLVIRYSLDRVPSREKLIKMLKSDNL